MNTFEMSVQSILAHKHFQQAEVLAGHEALHRPFKWIHILETLSIETLLKGQEFILTTGIHIRQETDFLCFIDKLVACEAAGLCVELGEHIQTIPTAVIERANDLAFPLMTFSDVVPFVEITQDIHRQLIHQQYELLERLEGYAQTIQQLALHITSYDQLLMHLQKYLNVYVVLELQGEEPVYLPNIKKEHYATFKQQQSDQLLSKDIILMKRYYGSLSIYHLERPLTEFDALILDRTVVTLSNYILRDLYIDQRQENENRAMLTRWMQGNMTQREAMQFLQEHAPKTLDKRWCAFVQSMQVQHKKEQLTYQKMFLRNTLEKNGFFCLSFEVDQYLVFLVADMWRTTDMKKRLETVVEQLRQTKPPLADDVLRMTIGIGRIVEHFHQLPDSYITALNTVKIRKETPDISCFFEDIPLQHMVLELRKNPLLIDYAAQFLTPLLDYDALNNGQLVKTLKVYLQHNGQKKETAQALFIVRQTLYHRLDKIESFLGKDYFVGDKRLAIELMLQLLEEPV